jgi:hypothetical protein
MKRMKRKTFDHLHGNVPGIAKNSITIASRFAIESWGKSERLSLFRDRISGRVQILHEEPAKEG